MKNILAAVDLSTNTDELIAQATKLAKSLGGKLWIIHVASDETKTMVYESTQFTGFTPEFTSIPGDVQLARTLCAEEYKREHQQLLGMSDRVRQAGVEAQAMLVKGDAAALILEKAEDLGIDIIVLGSRGHGLLHKALLGSVSEAVIRNALCNVMLIPWVAK
ncbi:MAG: universal stress protein [Kiritimatiellales bacterium]|nr:universal stress protein [Kiritimatiellales bacterium]